MPPHVRGKGKGPNRGGPSGHAGTSHRRTPSASFSSSDSRDHRGHSFEPAKYEWEFTPSYHNSPAQPPLDEPYLQAVIPPPLPVEEPPQQPPQPPPEPPRRRRNARITVRGGPRFSSPQGSSSYPPIPEDPQMGGPSHAVPEDDPPPVSYAPPPVGFEKPDTDLPRFVWYNPFEYPTFTGYGAQDPYLTAPQYNALYPSSYPPVYPTGYPVQGYQYPPYQQPPPPQQEQTQEILQRLDKVERKADETNKKHNSFLKGLASLIKGKKK
ncbi:extensin-like [Helianthus annuus]|uniref:extensin-like n=1 Tax=Helianthus annuus TaxID=4232 RepID=UPI000B906D9F|nr:extensin-like [Helianthus annuus]